MNLLDFFRLTQVYIVHSITLMLLSDWKEGRRKTLFIWSIVFLVAEVISIIFLLVVDYGEKYINLIFIATIALYFLAFVKHSSGSIWRKIFIFSSYASFFILSVTVANYISYQYFGNDPIATMLIRLVITIALVVFMILKGREVILDSTREIEHGWGALVAYSVMVLAISSFVMLDAMFYYGYGKPAQNLLFVTLSLSLSSFFVVIYTVRLMGRERDMKLLEKEQELLEYKIESERMYVDEARSLRHDIRHHVLLLQEMLNNGETEDAIEYLRGYKESFEESPIDSFCENSIANTLFSLYKRKAAKVGMKFSCHAIIPETFPLTKTELTSVLGNLLENAFDAAGSSGTILVWAQTDENKFLLSVENTCTGGIRLDGSSSKHEGQGRGLEIISRIIASKGGMFRNSREGKFFVSKVVIPL